MRHVAAIVVVLLLAGCAATDRNADHRTTFVTPESAARMGAVEGLAAKRAVAQEACVEAGANTENGSFARCVTEHFAVEAARLRGLAQYYSDRLARRHGLCLDRSDFTIHNCVEI